MLSPILEQVSEERDDVEIYNLNVDESPETSAKYGIRSLPTLIVFKDGKEIVVHIGNANIAKIDELIDVALKEE